MKKTLLGNENLNRGRPASQRSAKLNVMHEQLDPVLVSIYTIAL